jgi:hypothetical protein
MWNFFLGYFFARSIAGERAARAAVLIVILGIVILVISTIGSPTLAVFRDSFLKGWRDGQRSWDHARQTHSAPATPEHNQSK